MKRGLIVWTCLILFAVAVPVHAQESTPAGRGCDPTGTWFGGGDPEHPYHMTIQPVGGGRYSWFAQQAIDFRSLGIPAMTSWTGEMSKNAGQEYVMLGIAFYLPVELDAVRSFVRFSDDCNSFTNTIDTYLAYVPWNPTKIPFQTTPDFNVMELIGVETLTEHYTRMPTTCPGCPFPTVAPKR